jgi:chromosome segregation ATPase
MDLDQLAKTVAWLDDERRKDKQEIAALQTRLAAMTSEHATLSRRLQQAESDLTAYVAQLQKVAKIDTILDGYRKEMTKQLEEVEQRRLEAAKEDERLRKLEREGLNKSLSEMRKSMEAVPGLLREPEARKETENRLVRTVAELQLKVTEFNKYLDERGRSLVIVEEGRRQDTKRIAELQTEQSDLRKRQDETRGKLEIIEDLSRRTDLKLGEVFLAENERRAGQAQWLEAQASAQLERERTWSEMRAKIEAALEGLANYIRRIEQYDETNRELKRTAENFKQTIDLVERRINESTEIQRLAEERFRQDWAAFLADNQKQWSTHLLLREEQWREHDRLNAKLTGQVDTLDTAVQEAQATLQHWRAMDASRLELLDKALRQVRAEYEQDLTPTK